jgi:hypothetical protein
VVKPLDKRTDGRRGLVQDQQLALTQDRTGKGNNLSLADGQVASTRRDLTLEREPILVPLGLEREQARRAESGVKFGIVVLVEHVEVLPERTTQ